MLLVGAAGIGKTALLGEAASQLAADGWRRPRLRGAGQRRRSHRAHLGHARHAGHGEPRHRSRTRVRAHARVALVAPAGFAGAGLFQLSVFAWGMLGFAAVYTGIAEHAFDLTVRGVHRRTSLALTRSMAYHPEVEHEVAEMRIALEAIRRPADPHGRGLVHRGSTTAGTGR